MSALSQALSALREGRMVLLVDDEDRENEGDLILAAEHVTPEAINFMASQAKGLICLALEAAQVDRLGLPPMVATNKARRSTAFTISIEAREGITTGISAFDRAHTIAVASDPAVAPGAIVSPGHVFPLRAAEGGVLQRNGHTEGAVDLMKLAGLRPAGVICEVMADSGHMAHRPELEAFAARHGLVLLTVQDIIAHRMRSEIHVAEIGRAELPSAYSELPFTVHAFRSDIDGVEHLAIVKHPLPARPLVRLHSECLTGDALGSLRCDCGPQLQEALRQVSESDGGVVVYLRGHEGRGIGLANKIRAYALQDAGADTAEANEALGFHADARDYGVGAHILRALGIETIRLLTNNPDKVASLEDHGIAVAQTVPLEVAPNPHNHRYLATKSEKFGHHIGHRH